MDADLPPHSGSSSCYWVLGPAASKRPINQPGYNASKSSRTISNRISDHSFARMQSAPRPNRFILPHQRPGDRAPGQCRSACPSRRRDPVTRPHRTGANLTAQAGWLAGADGLCDDGFINAGAALTRLFLSAPLSRAGSDPKSEAENLRRSR